VLDLSFIWRRLKWPSDRYLCLWESRFRHIPEKGGWDLDPGHAGSDGRGDTRIGVLEDKAVGRGDAEALGGEEEGVGGGLAFGVVAGADEGVEAVEEVKGLEGLDDGLAGGAGDDGEGDFAEGGVDVFEDLGDGDELGEEGVVDVFLADGEGGDVDGEAVAAIELGDDVADGPAAPGVEEIFGERGAAVLAESFVPGDVVEGHGVGDGAIAVEEVGLEVTFGELESHMA
jgi:hypothetical protein